jgi:hypothetical protein
MISQADFDAAHAQWRRETAHHSFPWTILKGEGFEKVKAFGKDAIPNLIGKLQEAVQANEKGEHAEVQVWGIHALLYELTGKDIFVGEENVMPGWRAVDVWSTCRAWIEWGRREGHLA